MPYSMRDWIRDEFDCLEQGSMSIAQFEAYFYALSKYSYTSISIESEKIQKYIRGLDVSIEHPKRLQDGV